MNITIAQKKIAEILKQLEIESGETISGIGLDKIEVTRVGDESPRYFICVRIETFRAPGNNWETD